MSTVMTKRTGRYNDDVPALEAEVERLRAALDPFARYYDLNDCHELDPREALEVPIFDLLGAKRALSANKGTEK